MPENDDDDEMVHTIHVLWEMAAATAHFECRQWIPIK